MIETWQRLSAFDQGMVITIGAVCFVIILGALVFDYQRSKIDDLRRRIEYLEWRIKNGL